MKAAFKYFFLWLILQVIGAIILALPAYCVSMVAGGAVSDFEKVGSDPWFMSVIFLGSELLPLYVFLKMKYARLNFKYDYDFGDSFSTEHIFDALNIQVFLPNGINVNKIICNFRTCNLLKRFHVVDELGKILVYESESN